MCVHLHLNGFVILTWFPSFINFFNIISPIWGLPPPPLPRIPPPVHTHSMSFAVNTHSPEESAIIKVQRQCLVVNTHTDNGFWQSGFFIKVCYFFVFKRPTRIIFCFDFMLGYKFMIIINELSFCISNFLLKILYRIANHFDVNACLRIHMFLYNSKRTPTGTISHCLVFCLCNTLFNQLINIVS